ncbi:MAG: 50S ribosomal protein L31 [Alphaproteobacteria bacterium]|nr:50S ribosomal protein L31 [Alphaproteobacteria bacterium]
MKKGIHPKYNEIPVKMTNGEEITIYSTLSNGFTLEVDPHSHVAWTKGKGVQKSRGRSEAFNKKFGSFVS